MFEIHELNMTDERVEKRLKFHQEIAACPHFADLILLLHERDAKMRIDEYDLERIGGETESSIKEGYYLHTNFRIGSVCLILRTHYSSIEKQFVTLVAAEFDKYFNKFNQCILITPPFPTSKRGWNQTKRELAFMLETQGRGGEDYYDIVSPSSKQKPRNVNRKYSKRKGGN